MAGMYWARFPGVYKRLNTSGLIGLPITRMLFILAKVPLKAYLCGMTTEAIERFLDSEKLPDTKALKIDFKKRNSISGLIIKGRDYEDLKSKNFWRIVTRANLAEWKRTGNLEFAKIYSGSEFNKISVVNMKETA
jgi:hypothetical protein